MQFYNTVLNYENLITLGYKVTEHKRRKKLDQRSNNSKSFNKTINYQCYYI